MTRDYRKRFQGALALLTDIYVADVAAAAQPLRQGDEENIKGGVTRKKLRSFYLYDEMLVSLLSALSGSLDATWRQKLFTQTLLECPRVPPAALELVCNLCDMAAKPHDVQTGELPSMCKRKNNDRLFVALHLSDTKPVFRICS